MARFEDSIGYVLANEGAWSNHPNDPGGATFWGVSLRYLEQSGMDIDGDGDVDIDDVKALTRTDAIIVFARDFWKPLKLDSVKSQAVATRIFDMAVNMGKNRAVKILQKAANALITAAGAADEDDDRPKKLKVDGILGPKTRAAIDALDDVELMASLREHHAEFYRRLADAKPDLRVFLDGWLNRAYK
jgi:lysozyme family protein